METIYSTRVIDVKYVSEKKCLVQVWKTFCTSSEFRAVQLKTLEIFKEKKCENFISDTTNASLLKKEDTDWASENFMSELVKAGMKHLKIVLPVSTFTQLTVNNLEKAVDVSGSTSIRKFGSLESAFADL